MGEVWREKRSDPPAGVKSGPATPGELKLNRRKMALNVDRIQFLLDKIENSEYRDFGGIVTQLMSHLKEETKDNFVYLNYLNRIPEFQDWPDEKLDHIAMVPADFEDAKAVAFALYTNVSNQRENGWTIASYLTGEKAYSDSVHRFNSIFLDYLREAIHDILVANPELETKTEPKKLGDRVFIIHGHDEFLKTQVQLLLQKAGVNNLVLHDVPDKGRTIIDKLEQESKGANYAIALLTPDDVLVDGEARARQNVILEVGYFMGVLGKDRLRLLVKEGVSIPSDLQGILYERHDASGAWKMKILKELLAAGIYVDFQAAI